jgi:hypothetical protein
VCSQSGDDYEEAGGTAKSAQAKRDQRDQELSGDLLELAE